MTQVLLRNADMTMGDGGSTAFAAKVAIIGEISTPRHAPVELMPRDDSAAVTVTVEVDARLS